MEVKGAYTGMLFGTTNTMDNAEMELLQRKITYRLYPSVSQLVLLNDWLALHCRTYNALLEEHQRRYAAGERRLSFTAMCKTLTGWRSGVPALDRLNAQSLQVTAKRLDLAFAAFFRRLKAGEEPGYPRFKARQRFSGWGYKTYGDGWKLLQPVSYRANGKVRHGHRAVRLTGIGEIPLRGRARFPGAPVTAEVQHKAGKWYLSVTCDVVPADVARKGGTEIGAYDWGVQTLLTLVTGDWRDGPVETIANPRWLKQKLAALGDLQRTVSVEQTKAKVLLGLDPAAPIPKGVPVTPKLKRLYSQLRALHGKVARQRKDFANKLTAQMVSRFGVLATEQLAPAKMVRRPEKVQDPVTGEYLPNGAQQAAGLHRGILDAAPSMLNRLLATKAEEAGSSFALADTVRLKPTQRCHRCGTLVPKTLPEREHRCACNCVCGRDENAARTLLRWLTEGDFRPGTGPSASGRIETPPIAAAASAVWVE